MGRVAAGVSGVAEQISGIDVILAEMPAFTVLSFLAGIEAVYGAEISHDPRPDIGFLPAFWTFRLFAIQVSMRVAGRKHRCYRDVRHLVSLDDLFYELLAGLGAGEFFVHIQVQNRPSRIFALQAVL